MRLGNINTKQGIEQKRQTEIVCLDIEVVF